MTNVHCVPEGFPVSSEYQVVVDGVGARVAYTESSDFVSLTADGPVTIVVGHEKPVQTAVVRPISYGIPATVVDGRVSFTLERPCNVVVDIEGRKPLFIFASLPEEDVPDRSDPLVVWLEAGMVHDVGDVVLTSGQTLYVEAGAVLYGGVRSSDASKVCVRGRGIIDGTYWKKRGGWRRGALFQDCDTVEVRDVTIVNPPGWTLVFYSCDHVHVSGVREIGEGFGSDGIDIVASRQVVVEDCFVRSGDDNLVVKAFGPGEGRGRGGNVDTVEFRRCVLLGHGGCAMEIGHELRADEVRNVAFRDCDILWVHGHGAAMGIHNADRAAIRDILFEDIRIEHHYAHLLDFRIITSRWGKDTTRGHVHNVTLRNVAAAVSPYNPGYTVSMIGGWSPEHLVSGVRFDNLTVGGKRVSSLDDFDLYIRHTRDVSFC